MAVLAEPSHFLHESYSAARTLKRDPSSAIPPAVHKEEKTHRCVSWGWAGTLVVIRGTGIRNECKGLAGVYYLSSSPPADQEQHQKLGGGDGGGDGVLYVAVL